MTEILDAARRLTAIKRQYAALVHLCERRSRSERERLAFKFRQIATKITWYERLLIELLESTAQQGETKP